MRQLVHQVSIQTLMPLQILIVDIIVCPVQQSYMINGLEDSSQNFSMKFPREPSKPRWIIPQLMNVFL